MAEPTVDHPVSLSTSGYEDGLGRRTLIFDRECGVMLERLHVRPELGAFEKSLQDRIDRLATLQDERLAPVRGLERDADTGALTIVSEFISGNRLSDLLDESSRQAREESTTPGVDVALGLLLELLPALGALHSSAGLSHGAIGPGRIIVTPAGQVVLLDSSFAQALERLHFSRQRLWTEFRIAMAPAAGPSRFDIAADISQAALIGLMLTLGRSLRQDEYPDGLDALLAEVVEIAQIRSTSVFAEGLQQFFQRTLPLSGRRAYASADDAALDLSQVARAIGITQCRSALGTFVREMNAGLERAPIEHPREIGSTYSAARTTSVADPVDTPAAPAPEETTARPEAPAPMSEPADREARAQPLYLVERAARPEMVDPPIGDDFAALLDVPIETTADLPTEAAAIAGPDSSDQYVAGAEAEPVYEAEHAASPEPQPLYESERVVEVADAEPSHYEPERPYEQPAPVEPEPAYEPEPVALADPVSAYEPVAVVESEPACPEPVAESEPQPAPFEQPEPAPIAAPPEPTGRSRRQKRGSKSKRDKLRSNAAPIPVPVPVPVPVTPAPLPAPRVAPAWQPPMTAQVMAPQAVKPTLAPAAVRVKTVEPAGYAAPAAGRMSHREGHDVAAVPYGHHRSDKSGSAFPWKSAAAVLAVIVVGAGAARAYLPDRSTNKPAATAAAPAAAVAKPTGSLEVASVPTGVKVLLDGNPIGETPLTVDDVPVGKHALTFVTASGTVRKVVRVEADKTLALDVPVYAGWVAVFAPIPLEIAEKGRAIGTTEQGRIMLAPGRHSLTLSNHQLGYRTERTVDIEPGEERAITVQPTGVVSLNATPWAEVWIDGQKAGETPMANMAVPIGTREIVFKHPEFGERRMTTIVTASQPVTLGVDFTKPPQN